MNDSLYEKRKKQVAKLWEEITIQNNFVFGKTMEMNPKLCKELIEHILKLKIKEITYPEREKTIENRIDGKGVRLDVYVKDQRNRIFDLEMQVTGEKKNLAKRMRYYQGVIDGDTLKRGEYYTSLRPTYIIFICPFDPFKSEQYIYTFRETCVEKPSIKFPDQTYKIILNTKGKKGKISKDLKNFLNYIETGDTKSDFTKNIDNAVNSVKNDKRARAEFMGYEMDVLERELKAEKRGEKRGREAMRVEMNEIISEKDKKIAALEAKLAKISAGSV